MGRKCIISIPINRDLPNTTTTDYYEYDDTHKYEYYIFIQEDPSKKLLELFGFSKESTNAKPLIALCPAYREKTTDELLGVAPICRPSLLDINDSSVDSKYTFTLGSISSSDNMSDGYPKDNLTRIDISEGCKLEILMYHDDNPSVHEYQSYTVEQVLQVEDSAYYTVNLVPERSSSKGVSHEDRGDSGSRYIMQDDD